MQVITGAQVNSSVTRNELRIAFFISSYRSPLPLIRLVQTLRLSEPDSPIVILQSSFEPHLDFSSFASVPNVHILTSEVPILWGDLSLDVERWRVFHWIFVNLDVDWVILLSEQDYPISSPGKLRTLLADSGADALIGGRKVDEIEDEKTRRAFAVRYFYQYTCLPSLNIARRFPPRVRQFAALIRRGIFFCVNHSQRYVFISMRPEELQLPSWFGWRARKTPFSASFPCWHHHPWYAISRKAIQHVLDYVRAHPEVVRYYERTVIPLESIVGTIIFNDPELEVANVGLHETRWTDAESSRPGVFTLEDLPHLRASTAVFARKFDEESSEVLDELDKVVLGDLRPKP